MGARHLTERSVLVYWRIWLVLVSGSFELLFYLLGIGFGLGAMVGSLPGPDGQPIPYQLFVAPALMATSAMNGRSTTAIFQHLQAELPAHVRGRAGHAAGGGGRAIGEIAWALIRGTLYAIGFFVVMFALGLVASILAVLTIPAAMLIGFAAAVGMAATTWMRKIQDFDSRWRWCRSRSSSRPPSSRYRPTPPSCRRSCSSPLYHGVELRDPTLGHVGPWLPVHVGYLGRARRRVGLFVCSRRLGSYPEVDRRTPSGGALWMLGSSVDDGVEPLEDDAAPASARPMKRSSRRMREPRPMASGCIVIVSTPPVASCAQRSSSRPDLQDLRGR